MLIKLIRSKYFLNLHIDTNSFGNKKYAIPRYVIRGCENNLTLIFGLICIAKSNFIPDAGIEADSFIKLLRGISSTSRKVKYGKNNHKY